VLSALGALAEAQDQMTNGVFEKLDSVDREAIRRAVYAKLHAGVQFLIPLHDGGDDCASDAEARLRRRIRDIQVAMDAVDAVQAARPDYGNGTEQKLSDLADAVKRLEAATLDRAEPQRHRPVAVRKRTPKFSTAADQYHQTLLDAHGERYDELKYIRHRKAIFVEICGDKRIDEYTAADLQHFVNRVAHLPSNQSKLPDLRGKNINQIIDDNIKMGGRGLAESTLVNNYLGKVKTILRQGCASAGIPFTLNECRIVIPRSVSKPAQKFLASHGSLNSVFRKGVESGDLGDAMLPLLAYLTGRRLGLLTFLRSDQIIEYEGSWVVTVTSHAYADGRSVRVPVKTSESMACYVLHNFLNEIGFISWARQQSGFVFASLQKSVDPARVASKRMGRLFNSAGIDRKVFQTFHGLRHLKIAEFRDLGLDTRTIRLQVGHELESVHDKYGGKMLRRQEIHEISHLPLPDDVDWEIFKRLNFDLLAASKPIKGRPPFRR